LSERIGEKPSVAVEGIPDRPLSDTFYKFASQQNIKTTVKDMMLRLNKRPLKDPFSARDGRKSFKCLVLSFPQMDIKTM
jgi:hypothetical protein